MKLYIIMTILMLSNLVNAGEKKEHNCYWAHINESYHINLKKKKIYHEITAGKSDFIFANLLWGERFGRMVAKPFDKSVAPYLAAGIDLFCQEFVKMNESPVPLNLPMPTEPFQPIDGKAIKKQIKLALEKNNLREVSQIAIAGIQASMVNPRYQCMTRHILESIVRLSYFYPLRKVQAAQKNLPDPYPLFKKVIHQHLMTMGGSMLIDRKAYPIQKKGVPVVCHELPNILSDLEL